MNIGQATAPFWFRQTLNVVVWWFALAAVWGVLAPGPQSGGPTAVAKMVAFGVLAAFVTWKWPPYTAGLTATWWLRFSATVSLWLFALERLWKGLMAVGQGHAAGSAPIGNGLVFALVVVLVTWFALPRQTVLPQ